jgi:dihydrofolate reductase
MINIIAAIGKNRELGANNKLLWHIPKDMAHFKKLTLDQVVIMGRKTFESLPKKNQPLPHRINIVVTTKNPKTLFSQLKKNKKNQLIFCSSLQEAIIKAKEFKKEIFIIGGASLYQQAISLTDRLYLTLINQEFPQADVFFPDYSQFKIVEEKKDADDKYQFSFLILQRKK